MFYAINVKVNNEFILSITTNSKFPLFLTLDTLMILIIMHIIIILISKIFTQLKHTVL